MTYRDFTLNQLKDNFGTDHTIQKLFNNILPVKPSESLINTIEESNHFPLTNEKGKSEFIVVPILREIIKNNNFSFTVYSGENLDVDKDRGLCGECDFIITKNINKFEITAPLLAVVEAKKQDIEFGIRQCASQLIGIKLFNEKYDTNINPLYGCVTIASEWRFLKLENNLITIDSETYILKNELPLILGIFQNIIDTYKN